MMKLGLYIVFMLFLQQLAAQSPGVKSAIENAIKEKDAALTENLLQKEINHFYKLRQPDSLNAFIFYVGRLAQLQSDTEGAVKAIEKFIARIKKLSPGPGTLRQTYIDAYMEIGRASCRERV